jgi:transcription factor 1
MYLPWLKPLIERPESRFHLRDWDAQTSFAPERYISDGLLPKNLGGAGAATNCNNSLLIVANFAEGDKKIKQGNWYSRIRGLIADMQTQQGLQAYGPVRMLVWLPAQIRRSLLPMTVSNRGPLALVFEMACHAEEIVATQIAPRKTAPRRAELLSIKSSIRVLMEMERRSIHMPPSRQSDVQKVAQEWLRDFGDEIVTSGNYPRELFAITPRSWHRELEKLQGSFEGENLAAVHPPISTHSEPLNSAANPRRFTSNQEYIRLRQLQNNLRHIQKNELIVESLIQDQCKIDSLERELRSGELDVLERDKKLRAQKKLEEQLKARVEQSSIRIRGLFMMQRDDSRALAQDPPLLMWDRRTAEPLLGYEDEVFPTAPFSLLDLQPHPGDLYPMSPELRGECMMIAKALFLRGYGSIHALDHIAPGACSAVLPKVGVLRDPLRGGKLDLSVVPSHMLTTEMLYGITKAWNEWPLKPSADDYTLAQMQGLDV